MNDQEQTTLDYYSANCESFVSSTISVPFFSVQDRFLAYLGPGSHILDLGCGSGRDARYFQTAGYTVTAMDGCPERKDRDMAQYPYEKKRHIVTGSGTFPLLPYILDGLGSAAAIDINVSFVRAFPWTIPTWPGKWPTSSPSAPVTIGSASILTNKKVDPDSL